MSRNTSSVVHTVFTALLLAVSVFLAVVLAIFDYDFFTVRAMEALESGEQLAQGLGLAIIIIFVIVDAIALAASSVIGTVLSATMVKLRFGGVKVFGTVSLVMQLIFLIFAAVSFGIVVLAA